MRTIWFHSADASELEALEIAAHCPAVTDVMILGQHRQDLDVQTHLRTQAAIAIVRGSKARMIWCRDLTPYYALEGFSLEDLYSPDFYIDAICQLRIEARAMGAAAAAIDTEPYANSPFKQLARSATVDAQAVKRIAAAVTEAVGWEGKLQYVLPAGSLTPGHPYHALAKLGRRRICENTYSGTAEAIAGVHYPYELRGLWIHTTDREPDGTVRKYTPVGEVFTRPELRAGKQGLFLFPRRPDLEVARELARINGSVR